RAGDRFRFYEINPLVIEIARRDFTFLKEGRADVTVVPGDARLSLEREPPQRFDMLALDAFSGDSIPVHLLTLEAIDLYLRHLAPGGLLATHVSNRYLDLAPVVALAARARGLDARLLDTKGDDATDSFAASWVLVPTDSGFFGGPPFASAAKGIAIP